MILALKVGCYKTERCKDVPVIATKAYGGSKDCYF